MKIIPQETSCRFLYNNNFVEELPLLVDVIDIIVTRDNNILKVKLQINHFKNYEKS